MRPSKHVDPRRSEGGIHASGRRSPRVLAQAASPAGMLALQRAVGNRAARRALARHPDDLVAYTGGQSGTVAVFKAGKLRYRTAAVSGHAGHSEWEVNVGPTPTGSYIIRPGITNKPVTKPQGGVCGAAAIAAGYQEIVSTAKTECAAGSAHYCNVPCPTAGDPGQMCWTPRDCWGAKRIKIEGSASVPKPGGGKQRRDGFYLHGGNPADAVSSGCVKSLDDDVFTHVRALTGDKKGRVRFCVGSACPPWVAPALAAGVITLDEITIVGDPSNATEE